MSRKYRQKPKLWNRLYSWSIAACIILGLAMLALDIVDEMTDIYNLPENLDYNLGFYILFTGVFLYKIQAFIRRDIECTSCLSRFRIRAFRESGGVCPVCGNKLFNLYRQKSGKRVSIWDLSSYWKDMRRIEKRRYTGERLLQLLGRHS